MTRYYETNIDPRFKAESDFVYRKRHGTLLKSIGYFSAGIGALFLLYFVKDGIGGDVPFLLGALLILIMLAVNFVVSVQRNLDLVTAIEFQNALFSSAFREGKLFSLIIGQDDEMYYADAGFYKLFPDLAKQKSRILDDIARYSENPQLNIKKITDALLSRKSEYIDITIPYDVGHIKARLIIMPLPRPSGYFFVSARKYEEHRTDIDVSSAYHTPAIATYLLKHLDDLAYIINSDGVILAATEQLAIMLEYPNAEALYHLPLMEILFNPSEKEIGNFITVSHEDTHANIRKKSGKIQKVRLMHIPIDEGTLHTPLLLGKIIVD
jgi:hypothetical protein